MKYGKSAFPYLVLLFILLVGMPLINHKMQKAQEIVVEIKKKKPNNKNQQLANTKKEGKETSNLLLMTSN